MLRISKDHTDIYSYTYTDSEIRGGIHYEGRVQIDSWKTSDKKPIYIGISKMEYRRTGSQKTTDEL